MSSSYTVAQPKRWTETSIGRSVLPRSAVVGAVREHERRARLAHEPARGRAAQRSVEQRLGRVDPPEAVGLGPQAVADERAAAGLLGDGGSQVAAGQDAAGRADVGQVVERAALVALDEVGVAGRRSRKLARVVELERGCGNGDQERRRSPSPSRRAAAGAIRRAARPRPRAPTSGSVIPWNAWSGVALKPLADTRKISSAASGHVRVATARKFGCRRRTANAAPISSGTSASRIDHNEKPCLLAIAGQAPGDVGAAEGHVVEQRQGRQGDGHRRELQLGEASGQPTPQDQLGADHDHDQLLAVPRVEQAGQQLRAARATRRSGRPSGRGRTSSSPATMQASAIRPNV